MTSSSRRIHRFAEVSSTQDVAKDMAQSGAAPGTVVVAERQIGGRGRLGRPWLSPPGLGLYMSVIMPSWPSTLLASASLAAGVAVREAIERSCSLAGPCAVHLKWPNDILAADGRKLGGLLIEAESRTSDAIGAGNIGVLGIGINVGHSEIDFPPQLRQHATSIRVAFGVGIQPDGLIDPILVALDERLALLREKGFPSIRDDWMAASEARVGDEIAIREGGRRHEGQFEGLSDDGALRLRISDGSSRTFHAGEVSLDLCR